MARRRLSTNPPSNPRYPLITPDNERDAFLDYTAYDGDANFSRTHLAYPVYQPREKSPAPPIVRVGKQPEMIRRPSMRPFAGHWETYDADPPIADSKIPGSFQDTYAEDLGPEIIEAIPRAVPFDHSRPADITDLHSKVSDDDLDVGQGRTSVFPQLPIEDVIFEVAYVLRMKSNPAGKGEGFTYVFADPTGRSRFYKIGSSKNVSRRGNEHRSICNLSTWVVKKQPATALREYKRLEKLAQTELVNLTYDPTCVCATQNREYFWGREQTAFEILEFWSQWLVKHSPYSKDGYLLPFWDNRLKFFEAGIPRYFNCGSPKCAKRTVDTVACQVCLRSGWKAWAEPSRLDKVEFASRTQIGIEWIHKPLMYLCKYIPVKEKAFLLGVDGIAWTLPMWDRFKSPALLLNLMYARILIPLLWSSIFTTTDYIPVMAIFEIVLFSIIFQLVRSELAQLYHQPEGRASSVSKNWSRSPHGKSVISILDNSGDVATSAALAAAVGRSKKQSKVIDIPDDRAQQLIKESTGQKVNGKKVEGLSVLFPGEAAARLKKFKTGRRKSDFV